MTVQPADPHSPEVHAAAAALRVEIQTRYAFTAPDPYGPSAFAPPLGGVWLALDVGRPVGSAAVSPLEPGAGEVDLVWCRRPTAVGGWPGPCSAPWTTTRVRSACRCSGRWRDDPTARCLEKHLDPSAR